MHGEVDILLNTVNVNSQSGCCGGCWLQKSFWLCLTCYSTAQVKFSIWNARVSFIVADRLPNWSNSILGSKRSALNCTVLNVTCGIPQGSVLGPKLLALYNNDLQSAVPSGTVFVYADDTTVYCIGDIVDNTVTSLNKALSELNSWCLESFITPTQQSAKLCYWWKKSAHRAAKFSNYWRGSDRVGEAHSAFGC